MSENSRSAYAKALDLFGEGRLEEAAQTLERLIELDAGHADAYEALGRIYYRLGRLDEAIAWMEKLAALKPDHAMAHTNLSIFYMKKGMKERAEEEKAKATVLNFGRKI